eukprot:2772156-Pyramimonas_sp.AAC.1
MAREAPPPKDGSSLHHLPRRTAAAIPKEPAGLRKGNTVTADEAEHARSAGRVMGRARWRHGVETQDVTMQCC